MVTKRVHNIPDEEENNQQDLHAVHSPDQFQEQNDEFNDMDAEPVGFCIGGRRPRPLKVASKSINYAVHLIADAQEDDDDKGLNKTSKPANTAAVVQQVENPKNTKAESEGEESDFENEIEKVFKKKKEMEELRFACPKAKKGAQASTSKTVELEKPNFKQNPNLNFRLKHTAAPSGFGRAGLGEAMGDFAAINKGAPASSKKRTLEQSSVSSSFSNSKEAKQLKQVNS